MKLQNSLVILTLLLSACTTSPNSVDALKKWDDKYAECSNLAISNANPFPESDWFNILSFEDKKTVIGYLYNYNNRQCIETETKQLREALTRDGNESLLNIFSADLNPLEDIARERIKHLNMSELMKLQQQYPWPFNLTGVVEQLNLDSRH
ncbi:hypothetical protein [Photobacterium sanguinicancri]|uniref:Lipoprotein n=1 Tax=Photobacterium sanguinicancri TaxID=875932 RepID=A0AAW7YEN9_9GAMM|nr:hypothetical protein [Photobacterium sanguinicancri]MDO6545477.1 hypothetical protein [Photobacterium sanguinicancri]OZS41639.1 hypothetical protein ASV53_22685 [Photobacterium sanguinicancri]